MNVVEPILYHARNQPQAPAIIVGDAVIAYAELDDLSRSIAARLAREGIGPGDRVVIGKMNRGAQLIVFLALARLGAVAVGDFTGLEPQAAQQWAARLGCRLLCRSARGRDVAGVPTLIVESDWMRSTPAAAAPAAAVDGATPVRITFSSGTTGSMKAVPITHGALLMRLIANDCGSPLGRTDRVLLAGNINAGYAFVCALRVLSAGGGLVFSLIPDFARLAAVVERHAITQLMMPTFVLTSLTRTAPPQASRTMPGVSLTYTGAALPASLRERVRQLYGGPMLSMYGATEVGPVAYANDALLAEAPEVAGRLLPWAEVEAVDDADQPLPPGRDGVLRVRSAGMAPGYLDEPELTARSFRGGWFYPGDIGSVTHDGVLRVTGRNDDLINAGGNKFAATKAEEVLAGVAGVNDVGVVALPQPDGSSVVGVGYVAAAPIDPDALRAPLKSVVPSMVRLEFVRIDAVPRNEMGKIVRAALRARVIAGLRAARAQD